MTTVKRGVVRDKEASRVAVFLALLKKAGLPHPHREYRFEPSRKWRADYCWPERGIILEVEGGIWTGGRHTRGAGFLKDAEKYNHAATLGYRVVRVTPQQLCAEETLEMLKKLFDGAALPQEKSA
jgi:very-short-patch-repair endonuclease